MNTLQEKLHALLERVPQAIRRGIEKESLRVGPDGKLSDRPHPRGLGSALTHPHITTDFSESQLELITGVHAGVDGCLQQLREIHQFVYRQIGDEVLWANSMPCQLPPDDAIPLGQYGRSNVGRSKTVYRNGLSHRYGRRMQTICGVHYNYSLADDAWPALMRADRASGEISDYRNAAYFSLIRNFRRHSWLLIYLFGASPAVCRSFVAGRAHRLQELSTDTLYLPYATSLRMTPLGYQSEAQAALGVSYNDLESYAASLKRGMTQPYAPYESIGLRDGDAYRQLATSLLQIENEFYGTIRPKRTIRRGERPLRALMERGVEYVEVRCMDLDSYHAVGIDSGTMRFLDVFLLHCLLTDNARDTPEENARLLGNVRRVAERGRDPATRLARGAEQVSVGEWGADLIGAFEPIAAALDGAEGTAAHAQALAMARARLGDASTVPSARILEEMRQAHGDSFVAFTLAKSIEHRQRLLQLPLAEEVGAKYARMAAESIDRQQAIEAADTMPFETYRQQYLAQVS